MFAGSKVVVGQGGRWVQLWSADEFRQAFGRDLTSDVYVGASNGDASSPTGSNDQLTARIVPGTRVDVLYSEAIGSGMSVRVTYLVVLF